MLPSDSFVVFQFDYHQTGPYSQLAAGSPAWERFAFQIPNNINEFSKSNWEDTLSIFSWPNPVDPVEQYDISGYRKANKWVVSGKVRSFDISGDFIIK